MRLHCIRETKQNRKKKIVMADMMIGRKESKRERKNKLSWLSWWGGEKNGRKKEKTKDGHGWVDSKGRWK